ncbi:hypothetical protein SAMN05421753_1331 [Planctomicrobium piriforme]|uniref:Uncharacterized protein n=1 Tax=Planctomicrobium piriforme TaxID=1576369 RepID=A0A1I3TP67_9PLAN|nr:hypothetical protein SAMN05421753_1331 [Planctomicrobium piriforme]
MALSAVRNSTPPPTAWKQCTKSSSSEWSAAHGAVVRRSPDATEHPDSAWAVNMVIPTPGWAADRKAVTMAGKGRKPLAGTADLAFNIGAMDRITPSTAATPVADTTGCMLIMGTVITPFMATKVTVARGVIAEPASHLVITDSSADNSRVTHSPDMTSAANAVVRNLVTEPAKVADTLSDLDLAVADKTGDARNIPWPCTTAANPATVDVEMGNVETANGAWNSVDPSSMENTVNTRTANPA